MKTKPQAIKWIKENNLKSMIMQAFPPDGWQWNKNAETKTYDLVNFNSDETITIKDVTDE